MRDAWVILIGLYCFFSTTIDKLIAQDTIPPHIAHGTIGAMVMDSGSVYVFRVVNQDSLDKICAERGHVQSGYGTRTLMMPYTRIVDLPDKTLKIYCDHNISTYSCLRCYRAIRNVMGCDTTVIWKRDESSRWHPVSPRKIEAKPFKTDSSFRNPADPPPDIDERVVPDPDTTFNTVHDTALYVHKVPSFRWAEAGIKVDSQFLYPGYIDTGWKPKNWDERVFKSINVVQDSALDDAVMYTNALPYVAGLYIPLQMMKTGFNAWNAEYFWNGVEVAGAEITALGLNLAIKEIVKRPRPFVTHKNGVRMRSDDVDGYSFPSGHTTMAFALATSVSLIAQRWWITVPSMAVAALVGVGRIYSGAHYPTDVIGGAALGIGSSVLVNSIRKAIEKDKAPVQATLSFTF